MTLRVDLGPVGDGRTTEDLESLEETIEILADADTMRRLHASEAELARGEVESRDELDSAMARRRSRRQ